MSWGTNCYFWVCTKCKHIYVKWKGERSICPECNHDDGRYNNE